MDGVLTKAGVIAIAVFIILIIKIIDNYVDDKKIGTELSDKVYQAAKAFSQGKSEDEVRNLMMGCIDFDEEDIEEVLSQAASHRSEEDGGRCAFIEEAKKVISRY